MTVTLDNKPIVVPDAVRRKAGLRRGEKIEFKVSGRVIRIIPKAQSGDEYTLEAVTRIIGEAKTEKAKKPMSTEDTLKESKRLARYGAKQAKKLGIKAEDVNRIIHEHRQSQRA
jgi:bifunctional DNA-binding transcriptional regulator/antitoxin component of YhaV-PrlF toxin-antitoxin module